MANDVMFEGKERRMAKIEKCLAEYGLASLEEARDLCLSKGIDVDILPELLSGHYEKPPASDAHRGMGIGLSICNTIVQAHGGILAAKNHDSGAEFYFTLPKEDNI